MIDGYLTMLREAGALICKTSNLGGIVGVATPVLVAIQAVKDRIQGKVRFRPFPPSGHAKTDNELDVLRQRFLKRWRALIGIGVADAALFIWLFVVEDIPKHGTTLRPTSIQSGLLILLAILTAISVVLAGYQLGATAKMERLKR